MARRYRCMRPVLVGSIYHRKTHILIINPMPITVGMMITIDAGPLMNTNHFALAQDLARYAK